MKTSSKSTRHQETYDYSLFSSTRDVSLTRRPVTDFNASHASASDQHRYSATSAAYHADFSLVPPANILIRTAAHNLELPPIRSRQPVSKDLLRSSTNLATAPAPNAPMSNSVLFREEPESVSPPSPQLGASASATSTSLTNASTSPRLSEQQSDRTSSPASGRYMYADDYLASRGGSRPRPPPRAPRYVPVPDPVFVSESSLDFVQGPRSTAPLSARVSAAPAPAPARVSGEELARTSPYGQGVLLAFAPPPAARNPEFERATAVVRGARGLQYWQRRSEEGRAELAAMREAAAPAPATNRSPRPQARAPRSARGRGSADGKAKAEAEVDAPDADGDADTDADGDGNTDDKAATAPAPARGASMRVRSLHSLREELESLRRRQQELMEAAGEAQRGVADEERRLADKLHAETERERAARRARAERKRREVDDSLSRQERARMEREARLEAGREQALRAAHSHREGVSGRMRAQTEGVAETVRKAAEMEAARVAALEERLDAEGRRVVRQRTLDNDARKRRYEAEEQRYRLLYELRRLRIDVAQRERVVAMVHAERARLSRSVQSPSKRARQREERKRIQQRRERAEAAAKAAAEAPEPSTPAEAGVSAAATPVPAVEADAAPAEAPVEAPAVCEGEGEGSDYGDDFADEDADGDVGADVGTEAPATEKDLADEPLAEPFAPADPDASLVSPASPRDAPLEGEVDDDYLDDFAGDADADADADAETAVPQAVHVQEDAAPATEPPSEPAPAAGASASPDAVDEVEVDEAGDDPYDADFE